MPKRGPATVEDRLHRIEGQIRAIENMLESNEDMQKCITLIEAVQSSLGSVKLILIKEKIRKSVQKEIDEAIRMLR